MGGFLISHSGEAKRGEVRSILQSGVKHYASIKGVAPLAVIESDETCVAKFGRIAGTAEGIAKDARTGSWVASIGTWFLPGTSGGSRAVDLLNRCLAKEETIAQDLDGFFVIVFYDGRQKKLLVITDRVGSCHAYFCIRGDLALVSSSSMVLASLTHPDIDHRSCYEFLTTGTIFENRTLFSTIEKLTPATVYRFSNGRLEAKTQYWSVGALPISTIDGEKAVELLSEALIQTAKQVQGLSNRPLSDLTGGYDSRCVLAVHLAFGARLSTVVNGVRDHPDVLTANRIAATFNLDHHYNGPAPNWPEMLFGYAKKAHQVTDGEYDILEYANILWNHSQFTQAFDLSLNGSGGELARGYWWELLFPNAGLSNKISFRQIAAKRFAVTSVDETVFAPEARLDLVDNFTEILETENRGLRHLPNTAQMDNSYLKLRMQRWQGRIASSTDQIWPCLSLFLCRGPLEISLCTAPSLRRRSLLVRMMLERLNPRLAAIPLENGCPAVPVRWSNLYRFYPFLGYVRRKVVSKLFRGGRGRIDASRGTPRDGYILRSMLTDDEARDLLHLPNMKTAGFFAPKRFKEFIEYSRRPEFPWVGQLGRILTFERTMRVIE